MTTTLHTTFSVYEVNQADRVIRRLTSSHEPTHNQGNDGEWKPYAKLTWIGKQLLVSYGVDEDGVLRQTLLSDVQSIDGDPIDAPAI